MTQDLQLERPAAIDAERTILGAMLVEPSALADAIGGIAAEDFSLDSHQRIFRAIKDVAAGGHGVDLITVIDALKRKKWLDSVGGPAYLSQLTEGLPRRLAVHSYIRIVQEKSRMREAQSIGDALLTATSNQSEDSETVIARAIDALRNLTEETTEAGFAPANTLLNNPDNSTVALVETLQARDGIPYGFSELDELTGGAQRSELIIIAARPSMGKTALLCCIAAHQSMFLGHNVGVFTAEQKSLAILRRILSARARVDYQDIRRGTLRPYDRNLLMEQQQALSQASLYLDDQPKPTLSRIRARALRLQRDLERKGQRLGCLLIDQLSKVSHADLDRRMPRHERVGEITGGLKALAQELDIPIILLVQIGREGGKRGDRPQLTDLKDSGNIEEDADVVIFPHRPEYYDKDDDSLAGKGELILAKQREGPTGVCECLYNGRIMRWEDPELARPAAARQDSLNQERW